MMNKGTAALAVPILIGLLKGNKGSKSSQLSKKYDEILKRNQNLIKNNKKMVHEYDIVLEFSIIISEGEEDLSFDRINLNSNLQNIKQNFNKHPSNDFDLDHEDWEVGSPDEVSDLLNLMNMGVILDFTVNSDKTWDDEIITIKKVVEMFEKARSGTLSEKEKGVFIYNMVEPFLESKYDFDINDIAEYEYGLNLPPNLTEAGNYECLPDDEEIPDWFIESTYSSRAYDEYEEYGFIHALVKDFFWRLESSHNQFKKAVEQYEVAFYRWIDDEDDVLPSPGIEPTNDFWNYLYRDSSLKANMKLYSIAPNLQLHTELSEQICEAIEKLLPTYGEVKIDSITKKQKGARLRRR